MSSITPKINGNSEHQKVWNLLPWYVNHTLDTAEQDIVKRHVKTCIACRIELGQQQQIFEKIQQTDLLQQVSQVSFAQLKKRIKNQNESSAPAISGRSTQESESSLQQLTGFVKYIALAASLLLLAVPFMWIAMIDEPELTGEYRTLANSSEAGLKNNVIRIVFADQSDPEQIEIILKGISGHIVKGPSQNGVYEVQIGNQQTYSHEIADVVSRLRKNPAVIFAEISQ